MNTSTNTPPACSVCGSAENNSLFQSKDFQVPGTDVFTYLECGNCGCVQILNKPDDLSAHYPAGYYSHSVTWPPKRNLKWRKNKLRARNITGTRNVQSILFGLFDKLSKNKRSDALIPLRCAVKAGAVFASPILDVGCGTGFNILDLAEYGFQNLTGVDPFIKADVSYPNGVKIYKKSLHELHGVTFDLITLHHSFEHMDDPQDALRKLRSLLNPGKSLVIRMPVADGYGWKHYRSNWLALDAPRHLMIHTTKSMEILARESDLILDSVETERKTSVLLASELRLRNTNALDRQTEQRLKTLAAQQASQGIAEHAAFYLRRPL